MAHPIKKTSLRFEELEQMLQWQSLHHARFDRKCQRANSGLARELPKLPALATAEIAGK
jgi:hypothetical protein